MRIDLDGVSKSYRTRHGMTSILKDVSLHVGAGEHVGILGQNGSGKSTLIRILSGSEKPTTGTVHRGMSVSWPLAFGGAFLGALTGLDNVRFVCRLYGVDPAEKLPFIQEFTELGKYLREPVKSYSSGMRARLAFAVSMAIDFDCYLIDEIVAVGDDRFQRKCQIELFEKRADKAMLIVSHSPDFIREHCHKASVLVAGELTNFDNNDDAYAFYSSHELAMQPHMQEASAPQVVHLPENPATLVANAYHQSGSAAEFDDFLGSLQFDRAPVFDSCDVVGRLGSAGEADAAIAVARWLAKHRPDEPLFWITLGDLHRKDRQHIPAVDAYREALRLDRASYWGNRNLATELFDIGAYQQAIPYYERAIEEAPSADSKLELRLRWLDCNVLTDRVTTANKAAFGVPLKSFTAVDHSGFTIGDGRSARLAVGGLARPGTDIATLNCTFSAGSRKWTATPTFARNSIRRLASCSGVEAFGFVHYGEIGDADAVTFEIREGEELRLSGQIPVVRSGEWGGPDGLTPLDSARLANRDHRADATVLMYGLSAQSGDDVDIVPFSENLIAMGLYDEADFRLRHWLAANGADHDDRSFVVDLACLEIARSRVPGWREDIDALLADEAQADESAAVLANLGHARIADDDIAGGIQYYAQASSLASGRELIHFARGIHTAKLATEVPRVAADHRAQPARDKPELVHLFACDAGYFRRFAPALVESSARKRGEARVLIHAHIVDPDPEAMELAARLGAEFGLVVTTEQSPETITEFVVRRAYFTCARFLVAPELLRRYDCPILVTEADCLMNWDWSDLKVHVAGADAGYMHSGLWNWVPWTKIAAGICLFTPSRVGLGHADYIARYIDHAFQREGGGAVDLWTVDQVALWLAHVTREAGRFAHLPMTSVLTLATGDKTNLAAT
jgi:capsular polysaccharide transport system ATP-binding protein